MTLSTEKEIEQTWGSHQPVLKAVMEVLKPQTIVECGCGDYSTPILRNTESLLTIEHDAKWADKMRKKYPEQNNHRWLVYPLPVTLPERRPNISKENLKVVDSFYQDFKSGPFDFLFVDTFTSARVPAMIHLSKFAQIVVLHDLEPNSPEFYCYEEIESVMDRWFRYRFAPEGWIAEKHRIPWTDIFSRDPLPISYLTKMQKVIDREAKQLWGFTAELKGI